MTKVDKKDVYSWANCEEAKQYLNQKGYFSDTCYDDISYWHHGELNAIYPHTTTSGVFASGNFSYGLFIPEDKVKEVIEEKTYRPFRNQDEIRKYFNRATTLGCPLNLQHKRTDERFTLMVTGFFENGLVLPLYGALTWEQLFDMFILYRNGKQQPFGVKVEE